ncbi:hypothetical protein D6C00_11750 [Thiohalobacter thiocyanaticus]|uniref:Uncharacterized protein n=1 Tax=Thiohalobacter thiocyanaticus TaxID=585455 RepID=A0A426QLA0_9GAMM|nr:hypothetical protein D6C00_11750 [Thiohalobacter thiocyanaticus]
MNTANMKSGYSFPVIPAQAGIHGPQRFLDPGLRRDDESGIHQNSLVSDPCSFVFIRGHSNSV